MENKLTVGNLLDQYGRLVEKGYSNKLVKHYERARIKARKNKIKETNFYFFGNSEYGFFIEITDNWLYKLAEVGFYDLKRGFQYSKSYYKLFSKKDFFISESDNSLENYFKNNKILISIKNFENYKKIYVVAEKFDGKNDFACDLKAFNESSNAIVVSCSLDDEKEFCYFQKSLNYKLEGFLRIENQIYDVAPLETSFKWSRAVMPYINTWFWASITGEIENEAFKITLGEGISDTSSASENIIFINNKSFKLCNVAFKIKIDEAGNEKILEDWKVISDDGVVNLDFKPLITMNKYKNFLLSSRKNLKLLGLFSGFIKIDDKKYEVSNFFGFIERNTLRG
jgi:hypothetical protein